MNVIETNRPYSPPSPAKQQGFFFAALDRYVEAYLSEGTVPPGYDSAAEWWVAKMEQAAEKGYELKGYEYVAEKALKDGSPSKANPDDDDEAAEAREFLANYTGNFAFLLDVKVRADKGFHLTPRQVAAVLKCKATDQTAKPVEETDDEKAAREFLLSYTGDFDFLNDIKGRVEAGQRLSPKQVAAVLKCAARDRKPETKKTEPVTEGMYRTADGTIYKVQVAVHGSGNLYAKRLVLPNDRTDGTVDPVFGLQGHRDAKFEYERGAINKLTADDKMTLEQAKAFGALYGTCCVCGRTLTNEDSIEAGIGPVCADKGFWA